MQCVVTSPPYFGLRAYAGAGDAEIGRERTVAEYVQRLVDVFEEVRRVLRPDGTLWLNLGDSYAGAPKGNLNGQDKSTLTSTQTQENTLDSRRQQDRRVWPQVRKTSSAYRGAWRSRSRTRDGGCARTSYGRSLTPCRRALTDRPTSSHEYVFLLTKRARYYYDADAVRTPRLRPVKSVVRHGDSARTTPAGRRTTATEPDRNRARGRHWRT